MILRLLCIWLVFYSLLSSLMHGTMNMKSSGYVMRHQVSSSSSYSTTALLVWPWLPCATKFGIQKLYAVIAECIYVFHMSLKTRTPAIISLYNTN
jgi:hypothetical protein